MIGVFDSGLGGLTLVRHIRDRIPLADIHYVGDRARAPYGPRASEQVKAFSEAISRYLIDSGAEVVVVACNTASAAALHHLRRVFPDTPFVGMEPAVKPAARSTSSGVVGVVATAGTLEGDLYESVVQRFGADVQVVSAACPEWVELVEGGQITGPVVEETVRSCLEPLMAAGADHIVLGCTHFPILADTIRSVLAGRAKIIDPGPAVAKQAQRRYSDRVGTGSLVIELTGTDENLPEVAQAVGLESSYRAVVSDLT